LHPNAYLKNIRNVGSGLKARTKILEALENKPCDGVRIANERSLSYSVVMHHLRLLENEGIVHRKGRRPYYWVSTGLGQKRLVS
jgi:predicted transcriptional regulator